MEGEPFEVRTRGIDSLGHGNILRRSFGGDGVLDGAGEWGGSKSGWRIGSLDGGKRGGSLDSLGRGNILRRASGTSLDDELTAYIRNWLAAGGGGRSSNNYRRSLDSLGKGNILKRSANEGK